MAWRDELVAASFRGVEFSVEDSEHKAGGRRIALHEYPGRDDPYAEDMGRISRTFSIEGFLVGDDYLARGERLIDACNRRGPGELVHPYRGARNVVCNEITESVRTRDGRMARYTMTFTEAGANQFPAANVDTSDTVRTRSGEARTAVVEQFVEAFGL